MSTADWIDNHVPGFRDLTEEHKLTVMQFALLWSVFEAISLSTRASPTAIKLRVVAWQNSGLLTPAAFNAPLAYCRGRYFTGPNAHQRFNALNLDNTNRDPVHGVLSGATNDQVRCVQAVLLIVQRLRNNFLHGRKQAWGLVDQGPNFQMANSALMAAVEIEQAMPAP